MVSTLPQVRLPLFPDNCWSKPKLYSFKSVVPVSFCVSMKQTFILSTSFVCASHWEMAFFQTHTGITRKIRLPGKSGKDLSNPWEVQRFRCLNNAKAQGYAVHHSKPSEMRSGQPAEGRKDRE